MHRGSRQYRGNNQYTEAAVNTRRQQSIQRQLSMHGGSSQYRGSSQCTEAAVNTCTEAAVNARRQQSIQRQQSIPRQQSMHGGSNPYKGSSRYTEAAPQQSIQRQQLNQCTEGAINTEAAFNARRQQSIQSPFRSRSQFRC